MGLIEALETRRGERSQEAFAEYLNIDQTTYSRLLSGERNIGGLVAQRILAKYPDLEAELAEYVLRKRIADAVEEQPPAGK